MPGAFAGTLISPSSSSPSIGIKISPFADDVVIVAIPVLTFEHAYSPPTTPELPRRKFGQSLHTIDPPLENPPAASGRQFRPHRARFAERLRWNQREPPR